MIQKLDIAKNADKTLFILSNMANRHGLITGATGTGKTVTLQKIAESFSAIGVPVLLTDIKGDLTGLGMAAIRSDKLQRHLDSIGIKNWQPAAFPIDLWDIFADKGHPIRATVSDIGPLLFSRLLNLNQIQSGVLQLIFKIADDNQLLLLDFKDLRAFVQFIGDNAKQFTTEYGNISTSSIGAIQRSLLTLEQQGAEYFLGEPMFDIQDLIRINDRGQGIINVLEAEKLYQLPLLYSVFLLWFVSELFETLPEVGDLDKPKLILFFDEAHLLFNQTPPALLSKIEQVVRLIRSKGVGIYFVTQNPTDIPDTILGQLGHRIQHALRAFTPRDLKSIKVAAQTLRQNPAINTEQAITELAIGEALISFLDEKGQPNEVERSFIITPQSQMGIISENEQRTLITHSPLYGKYEPQLDRQSAYEQLQSGFTFNTKPSNGTEYSQPPSQINENQNKDFWTMLKGFLFGDQRAKGRTKEGVVPGVAKSITRNMVNRLGREITRGILGNLTKRRK